MQRSAQRVPADPPFRGLCFSFRSNGTLLIAVCAIVLSLILLILSAAALSCPVLATDRFSRTPAHSSYCLLPDNVNSVRNGFMIFLANALGLMAAGWVLGEACRAYTKFLKGGLSAPYARALTKQTGILGSLWWCARYWRREPGPRTLKFAVLATALVIPLLCSLLGILAGTSYSGITVRTQQYALNTTRIPDWITVDKLKAAHWDGGTLSDGYPKLASSSLMSASTQREPTLTGSGLPVVQTVDSSGDPLILPYLGYENILVDSVPFAIKDLSVDQGLLLIRKACAKGSSDLFRSDTLRSFYEGYDYWLRLADTLPKHQMPFRQWSESVLYADTYNYTEQPVVEQSEAVWNDTALTLRTLSPNMGTACRTQVYPVRAVVDIPANKTTPLLLTEYTPLRFPPAVRQWVSTALNLTQILIMEIDLGNKPELPAELGLNVRQCSSNAVLAADGAPAAAVNDSCVSSEIDKIFLGYLMILTQVPPVPYVVQSPPKDDAASFLAGNDSTADQPTFLEYTNKWGWGPVVTRFVPNRPVCGAMLFVIVLIWSLFGLLHGLTSLPGALVVRDIAPWVVLADTIDPPAALEGLAGIGVDALRKEEQQRVMILSLEPEVGVKGIEAGQGMAAGDGRNVYQVHGAAAACGSRV